MAERCVKTPSSQQLLIGCASKGLKSIVYSSKCLEYITLHKLASATPVLENMKTLYIVLKAMCFAGIIFLKKESST